MRQTLLLTLVLTLGLGACADHAGGLATIDSPTPPPVSPPDANPLEPTPAEQKPSPTNPGGGGPGGGGGGGGTQAAGGSPVPEPGTMLLVGTGLAGAALLRRRRKTPAQA